MYFSRATVNQGAVFSPEFQKVASGPYQIHTILWDLFSDSKERERDFLYRLDFSGGKPKLFVVSERKPEYYGSFWHIETKLYNPLLKEGQDLSFSLRANPVVTKTMPADSKKGIKKIRHDVVMNAKRLIKEKYDDKSPQFSLNDLIQQEGFRWLSSRSEKNGFVIREDRVRCDTYSQMQFFQGKKNQKVSISTIDFHGVLTVTDVDVFLKTLSYGLGPAKGFGCGLLLVKPF